nr:MAG TPA: hypothetical protein [Caudoviricetes sp.]
MVFNLKTLASNIKLQAGIHPHVHDSRNDHTLLTRLSIRRGARP